MCLQHLHCATSSFPAFECQNPNAHALQHLLRLRLWDFWQKLLLMVHILHTSGLHLLCCHRRRADVAATIRAAELAFGSAIRMPRTLFHADAHPTLEDLRALARAF
eukprot:CAMPEP_0177534318 /NCGR_PEP_ID=MMETSP0369-20130122/55868_1 /TAXON_ID=447022 ORGANISM="Scrippsiella hangoei-like, Strain SHHI-4" /NCGR_SAMPLE_ID=MMETSP0369 /ASSEMBLY_ACC=CAM_ASM_000364 /LENGTH=105 /DNA_ID=CAMNT_0019016231 /DNA_START=57 /DNA_END=371 /DNA_ORIENTATION=-